MSSVPCEVVEEVVEENHGDDTLSEAGITGLQVLGGQGNPNGESATHATCSNQEEWTTSDAVDHERPEPSLNHVDHENETIELVVVVGRRFPYGVKDVEEVIGSQTCAGKLGENTTAQADEDTIAVASY